MVSEGPSPPPPAHWHSRSSHWWHPAGETHWKVERKDHYTTLHCYQQFITRSEVLQVLSTEELGESFLPPLAPSLPLPTPPSPPCPSTQQLNYKSVNSSLPLPFLFSPFPLPPLTSPLPLHPPTHTPIHTPIHPPTHKHTHTQHTHRSE